MLCSLNSFFRALIYTSQNPQNSQPENIFCLQTCMSLCSCTLLWERSLLYWDLCGALGLRTAVCRDCRGLLPLLRNVMCVLLVPPLGGLRVQSAGNRSREAPVNKSPALTSVSCICFQIRSLVSRSNTSGSYSLPFKLPEGKVGPRPSHTALAPKICLQSLVSVVFCS